MATSSQPTRNLAEAHQTVRGPLERLRGYIRAYVSLEGAALLGLYLALWFWIGLILDFGLFRLFTFDWVQSAPWGLRLSALLILSAGLLAAVATLLIGRLWRQFRDPALALVLERRFPALLGDRLITAVEMADTKRAAAQGYSLDMVHETIHEAAARVDQLPVQQVFDWGRLTRRWIGVGVLTVALYLMVGAAFAGVDSMTNGAAELGGYTGLNETAVVWFERNILLQDVIWPRRAFLEIISLAPGEGIRIGRDTNPPPLRVRAYEYVVAGAPTPAAVAAYRVWLTAHGEIASDIDAKAARFARPPAEGWRPLTWYDLSPALLGSDVPADALPVDWDARDRSLGVTLDEVEQKLGKSETHASLAPEAKEALRATLAKLEERASQPGMRRTLRKLKIPDVVTLQTRGNTTSSQSTMTRGEDNEFTGQFSSDLKEAGELPWVFSFTVQGDNYYTARRPLTLLPLPTLQSLRSEERRPAYLYYSPGLDGARLRGRKQLFEPRDVHQSGNDVSRFDVPAGTDVTLLGQTAANDKTKELESVRLTVKGGGELKGAVAKLTSGHTFSVTFPDVRQELKFTLEMRDVDGVVGVRPVVIKARDDLPPDVNVEVIGVRKGKEGYLVSAKARVPFNGAVADESGLSDIRYSYTAERIDSAGAAADTMLMIGATGLAGTGPTRFLAGWYASLLGKGAALRSGDSEKLEQRVVAVKAFRRLADQQSQLFPFAESKLDEPQKQPYNALARVFNLKPDEWASKAPEEEPRNEWTDDDLSCDFPLYNLEIKDKSGRVEPIKAREGENQQRTRVQLVVEAVDTDVDGERGPHVKPTNEKFTFIVVSEEELLFEIGKDEEAQHTELQKVVDSLLDMEAKLTQVTQDLAASTIKADFLGPMSVRTEQVDQVLDKGQNDSGEVYAKYRAILQELRLNRVDGKYVSRVNKNVVIPLEEISRIEFERAHQAMAAFRAALDNATLPLPERLTAAREQGGKAKEQLRDLITKLNDVLGSMKGLIELNELIEKLRQIEAQESGFTEVLKKVMLKKEDDFFKDVPAKPGAKDKK